MLGYIVTGLLLGLSAGLTPGPTTTLIISHTLRYGSKEGAKIACAPLITDFPIIAIGILLIGSFSNTDQVLGWLSLIGAVIVFWLGVDSLRQKPIHLKETNEAPYSILKGVVVNATNPHPYIFWFGVGTPLVIKAAEQNVWYVVAFLLPFFVCIVGAKLVMAWLTGHSRQFLEGTTYLWIIRLLGIALMVFAVMLIREGLSLLAV